jgi:hypothetical protein
MPDEELFRLADAGRLRENLPAQVKRMLADSRSSELMRNFSGQWLHARDVDSLVVNASAVLSRDQVRDSKMDDAEAAQARFRELRRKDPESLTDEERRELQSARQAFTNSRMRFREFELSGSLRQAMRRETEMLFEHILREDRSVLDFLDARYTFVNERLAKHYGIASVKGNQFQRVSLKGTPRSGVLTHASVLLLTSNPTRTSPVKRGKYVLENILGTPPPPPPPDVPELEESKQAALKGTLRQRMEQHREKPMCASCHARMDPYGFALENYDGIGAWRRQDNKVDVDPSGEINGKTFQTPVEFRTILAERHGDFRRALVRKVLSYALGRGLQGFDRPVIDEICAAVEAHGDRFSSVIANVVRSYPFQHARGMKGQPVEAPVETTWHHPAPSEPYFVSPPESEEEIARRHAFIAELKAAKAAEAAAAEPEQQEEK